MKTVENPGEDFKAVKKFVSRNFRHFNAYVVRAASEGYVKHIKEGNKMLVALGGSMSTAELGITLAEMIREGKVHAISSTGANLEEDIFNLVAHDYYEHVPHYRNLSIEEETDLLNRGRNRVTDTCIPEEEAMRKIGGHLLRIWQNADKNKERYFIYEYFYQLLRSGVLKKEYQIDPRDSWVAAACEKNIPIFVPGWEDSTLGNFFVSYVRSGKINRPDIVKSGLETMSFLVDWYRQNSKEKSIGFFQIGGGISGDFPICVVPLIRQDLKEDCRLWGYFCQISDSTTSYGSYSGAVPNEKITWGKLAVETPKFLIESDATIVAPLMFAYVLADDD